MSRQPVNFEALALAKLITTYDKELLLDLDPSHFSGVYQPLFKIVLQHFSDTQRLPSVSTFEATATTKAPKAQLPVVQGVLQNIKSLDIDTVSNKEIVKGLQDKKLLRTMDSNIQSLTQAALNKDMEATREILNGIVEEANLAKARPTDFREAMDAPDTSKIIPTYMPGLDEHIVGVAGLTLIGASSGGGKTAFMLQLAVNAFRAGHSILFVSLELSAQVLGMRLKSLLTGIPFNKFVSKSLTPEEQQQTAAALDELFGNPNKHFRIVTTPLDSNELLTMIKVERALYNIDLAYVDYLNLVQAAQSEEGWKSISNTAKALHRLSMDIGVVTVSATQINLDKAPKANNFPVITTRGSAELMFSATVVFFLYKAPTSDDLNGADGISLYVLKNRNGPTKHLLLEARFDIMSFEFVMEI